MSELITLSHICKIYNPGENEVRALDDVSLRIDENEFVAIIGQSGSGKSTLMNMLGCLDVPTSGDYMLHGQDVANMTDDELSDIRNKEIGFIFQGFNLIQNLTALENVELPLIYRNVSRRERQRLSLEALQKVGLEKRLTHRPAEMSGGQQQRVAIARAIAQAPPVILADEPTGNLDSVSTKEIMGILRGLHEDGRTVILITHDNEIAAQAERIIKIKDGRISEDISRSELERRDEERHDNSAEGKEGMIKFRKKDDFMDDSQKEKKVKKPKNPARRKKRIKMAVAILVVLAIVGGVFVSSGQKKDVAPQIMATTVVRGDVETIVSTSGVVESEITQIYYAPMAAKVSELNVELGDAVKAGDMLLAYDTEDLEFKQRSDALEAQVSENSYQSSIAESNKQEAIYNESSAQLANVEALIIFPKDLIKQFEYYVEDEKTAKKLKLYDERYRLNRWINNLSVQAYIEDTEGVHVSQAQAMNELEEINKKLEELEADKELTELERTIVTQQEVLADLETMRDELKSDKNSSENGILDPYKKKELQAVVEKGRIAEQQAQAHLEEALAGIRADFNGIITELDINKGFVTEAGSKLMKLESSDAVRVNISLSKYDLSKVALGQTAEVEISGQTYEGTVSKINRMAEKNDSGTRLVAAEVHIENPDDNIYLGIEGKVKIMAQKSENTLVVPIAAINTDQTGDFCFVVKDGILERHDVTAGLSSEDSIEILDGLEEGDIVLTDTSMELTEGMQIEPLIM